ncbi:MAG: DUF134 domain-containing protein [Candidatus Aenigmarchaeota archaeon]|nr:DUF134 domain-containing protein [Candidatus Aenigmarchaeota archaeon]
MPRPRRCRRVWFQPNVSFFRPVGLFRLEEVILTIDEFEAMRLKDLLGLEQEKAAKKMNISQPTFSRLIESARRKVADAIVNGRAIKIQGGDYKMVGRGRMGGFGLGPSGECVCPSCGYRMAHQRGVPCFQCKCPKCGTLMTRAR